MGPAPVQSGTATAPATPAARRAQPHALSLLASLWPLALLAVAGSAQAHGEADDALPADPGVRLGAAAAVSWLDSQQTLPSQRLRGFLRQGDAGTDRQGVGLEHGTLSADWRINDWLGAELVLGKHGSDAAHVESAWVQLRHDVEGGGGGGDGPSWWQLTAGRQRPALGAAMAQAGHLDSFGLMPLAKQVALNGDWIDDGLQLGWRQDGSAGRFSADAGLWRGQVFPGGQGASPVPSVHAGWAQGPWALDGWAASLRPTQRGSLVNSLAGHTHSAPVCTAGLKDVVCFAGRSTVAGASVVWQGAQSPLAWPLTLTASGWLRNEHGSLESANGLAAYSARNRGSWLQGMWSLGSQWQTGLRLERAWATQSLTGAGASLVAAETGLAAYQPASRQTILLAWSPRPDLSLGLELGRERAVHPTTAGSTTARFAMLRLVASTSWLSGAK